PTLSGNLSTAPTGCGGSFTSPCAPLYGTFPAFVAGVGSLDPIAYVAETARHVTVNEGAVHSDSGTFDVNPAAAVKLGFSTAPQTLTAGQISATTTVQTQDVYSNPSNPVAVVTVDLSMAPSSGAS